MVKTKTKTKKDHNMSLLFYRTHHTYSVVVVVDQHSNFRLFVSLSYVFFVHVYLNFFTKKNWNLPNINS